MADKKLKLEFDYAKFGKSLKICRVIDRNVHMTEISEKTGLGKATISRIERGGCGDIDSVINLCSWMGVSVEQFVKPGKLKLKK